MNAISLNWWAVLVGVVINMLVGSLWFNPKTFFPAWWKVVGKDDEQPGMKGNMGLTWALTIVAGAVQAIFIGLAVSALGPLLGGVGLASGLETGAIIWLGFIAPTYLVNKLFAGHGLEIWAIEAGNHLVDFLLLGALFGLWR
jgi:Protein of unknown function (DUF1761)